LIFCFQGEKFILQKYLFLCFPSECRLELLENVDFPGTDIEFVYSPDVYHCQQMCTEHPSCLFFTFIRAEWTRDNRHFYCYLKKTSSGQPSRVRSFVTVLYSNFVLSAPCLDQLYPDLDFPGADYRSLFTPDYEECRRACTHDPSCQFFTWVNGQFSNEKISLEHRL
uniref:Apple domain-containing protein n=1 Tax=Periophthalmus magnuspinnatus TaxID=409849 RepID=A0A3B3ZPQ5_9GOBI